jgi:uncharacterized protein YcbK (DUF882 family)
MYSFKDFLGLFQHQLTRRHFLKMGFLATAVCALPRKAFSTVQDILPPERSLSFHNINTGESFSSVYWCQGKYVPEALNEINHILRDHWANLEKPIDTGLLDLLHAVRSELDSAEPFLVISGYRSPSTNARLRRRKRRSVARNSLHMAGKAVDVRHPACNLRDLRKLALNMEAGGVGYYPRSRFVHLDVGEVRHW